MRVVNAIAKARFGTAKPQRVQLQTERDLVAELLCLEAGQELAVNSGRWVYYIITGSASLVVGGKSESAGTGQLAATEADEAHTLVNAGEGRLLVLAVGSPK